MSFYKPGNSSSPSLPVGASLSEFDILKASHRFLREDDEIGDEGEGKDERGTRSWEDQLARKYYDNLYREFAVCDLKHYKTGHFALRWRTEAEVLEGEGEETCGNTRCEHHHRHPVELMPPLRTVELPFAYEEHGEHKSALVKVVLCDACMRKLVWKREKERKEKEKAEKIRKGGVEEDDGLANGEEVGEHEYRAQASDRRERLSRDEEKRDRRNYRTRSRDEEHRKRRRGSRSRSPSCSRHKHKKEHNH